MTKPKQSTFGDIASRVEYDITQHVWCDLREGVATFVFGVKEHSRRVVVPAHAYIALLEDLLAKAEKAEHDKPVRCTKDCCR